ncbi:hypothetical protein CCM_09309 [Cordyceps militaris CM01]|uniref:Uncharacterized protein n=1 Tax=Cordyceps militaris (strain CM01) TaxID=983644 RepID=G3JU19_CORMM|nr:uncharacterized protein CCM_09309 [Cordyceps militaris CM01]EGX88173.1 hypothetical protein CCM_09309 [Cordyceps militaris CM01]
MPGAFHNDVGAAATTTMASIFRPPVSSPSPSGSTFLDVAPKRKRGRTGTTAAPSADDAPAAVRSLFGAAAVPPLHTPVKAYTLAGTLDTPGAAESDVLGESMYSDSNYRTALGSKRSRHDDDDDDSGGGVPTSLFRHSPPSSPSQGWGSTAINVVGGVVGGVVGRVWEFCKAGAFKGFYAGGGRSFAMTGTGAMVESNDDDAPPPLPPADDYSYSYHYQHYDDYEHRVPGHFPASQPEQAFSYRATVDDAAAAAAVPPPPPLFPDHYPPYRPASPAPSLPAAKRRQTTHADDLGRNWVLVNDVAAAATVVNSRRSFAASTATPRKSSGSHRSSPRNRNYTPSVTTGRRISTTPNSRASMPSAARFSYRPETPSDQTTPQLVRPASSASYASPRSASPTKLTSYYTASTASTASTTASPSQQHPHAFSTSQSRGGHGHRRRRSNTAASTTHRRTNSAASAASSRGDAAAAEHIASPRLGAEAKQLAARRMMEERDADVRISAFNKRLQDMIRQGKEALGTTIEIDDAAGEDWVDEE